MGAGGGGADVVSNNTTHVTAHTSPFRGAPKVRCGPATVLQPRLPAHGLHRLLSSVHVQLAIECPIGPLCCSLSSLASARDHGFLGSGLYCRVTLHNRLSSRPGIHAVFHVGSGVCLLLLATLGGGGGGWVYVGGRVTENRANGPGNKFSPPVQ